MTFSIKCCLVPPPLHGTIQMTYVELVACGLTDLRIYHSSSHLRRNRVQ